MRTNKILVIPGGFVPYNDTVTLLSYKHLRNLNAEFDVLALKGKSDPGIQSALEQDVNYKKFHVNYICDYDQAIATLEKKNVLSGIYYLLKYCYKAAKKGIAEDYDFIYTSSIPAFTHLAGYWIKKKKGNKVKWIASLSDPLYKSPYKDDKESFKEYNLIAKIGYYIYIWIYMNGYYEKLCQKYADKIIYICEEQRDFTVSNYKNKEELIKKSMLIPLNYIKDWNIYSDLLTCDTNTKKNKPKIYSHFGRIYGLRRIDLFLRAVKELKDEDSKLSEKIIFEQYGQIIPRYKKQIQMYNIQDCFKTYDRISYEQVMEKMKKSDGLILFDTIMPEDAIQPYLPSKALEYILLKKSLFILTTPKSPSCRIFTSLHYECTFYDKAEIKTRLRNLIAGDAVQKEYNLELFENTAAVKPLYDYIENNSNKDN